MQCVLKSNSLKSSSEVDDAVAVAKVRLCVIFSSVVFTRILLAISSYDYNLMKNQNLLN